MERPIELISHRGARFEAPENTLEGFRLAKQLGMTTVEFDVQLTRDGELVVIHDATVDRTTNGTGAVSELTLEEIKALDARSVHVLWPTPVRVPTFKEALAELEDMPYLEIEIKGNATHDLEKLVRDMIATIKESGRDSAFVLTSIQPEALELAMEIEEGFPRGWSGNWDDPAKFNIAEGLKLTQVGIDLPKATPEIVQRAKDAGYTTVAWICNDEPSVLKAIELGYDKAGTDAPSVFAPMFGQQVNRPD